MKNNKKRICTVLLLILLVGGGGNNGHAAGEIQQLCLQRQKCVRHGKTSFVRVILL